MADRYQAITCEGKHGVIDTLNHDVIASTGNLDSAVRIAASLNGQPTSLTVDSDKVADIIIERMCKRAMCMRGRQ